MVKWFFLICIAAFAYLANMVILDKTLSIYERIAALIIVNSFALTALLIWLSAYIPRLKASTTRIAALLLFDFSLGAAFLYFGTIGLLKQSCDFLPRFALLRTWITKLSPNYTCKILAAIHLLISATFLWIAAVKTRKLMRDDA